MALRLTLAKGDGSRAGLEILVAPDTTVGDVAAQLFASDPSRVGVRAPEDPTLLVTPLSIGPHAAPRTVDRNLDLASSGIRSGDHIDIIPSADAAGLTGPRAVATVTVVEGPDVGKSFPLGAGAHTIGRGHDASVRLSDGMVSRRHARLLVGESLEVVDTGSTRGVALGEAYVTRATLSQGDRIEVGSTVLEVSRSEAIHHAAPTTPTVPLTRSPRVLPPLPQEAVELPQPPARPTPRRFPGIALVAPIVLGAAMFVVTGRVLSLLFVAMAPMMMVGTWWDARRVHERELRDATIAFDASLEGVRREIEAAHVAERAARAARCPSLGEVLEAVTALSPLVWATRPEHDEFLIARVGVGDSPSLVNVVMPTRSASYPGFWGRLQEVRDTARNVSSVPIAVDLRRSANVGLVGDIFTARAAARAVVAHLAGMHSPLEVVVAAFASPTSSRDWAWLWWLPHCSSPASPVGVDHLADSREGSARLLAALEGVVSERHRVDISDVVPEPRAAMSDAGPEPPRLPAIVVVVEDDAAADRNRLIRLAERGPDVNVHLVWLAPHTSRVPAACRTFVEVHAEGPATVGHVRRGGYDEPVTLESLTVREATDGARRLACVEDAGAVVGDTASVPSAVSFLELHGFDALDPACHEHRWRRDNALAARNQRPFSLRALVGHSGAGPVYLDLKTQGPHALVGGTTGAGKSEFLQSWVLGMAAAHGPDRVTFLYVDYKGGSAFSDCVNLPHSVGLVTDLTPQLVARALTSLRAELHYREGLLAAKGAKDLETLDRVGDVDTPPSLVIVIDEFAALVKEVPDFVDGMVDIAQRGRSLGLHLIMATQRPAGVIKDNLRANTNLRIALRMADEADSSDILGVRDAAHVDPWLPGRALARTGPGRVDTFQAAYAGACSAPNAGPPPLEVHEVAMSTVAAWRPPEADGPVRADGEPDARRVVQAMRAAKTRLGTQAPRRPWLDELAEAYDLAELVSRAHSPTGVVFGLVDNPSRQAQHVATYEPDHDGNLVVLGGSGAGKSTALRTIAVGATLTRGTVPAHIYGLDAASGGLGMLRPLPHVADVIGVDDLDRVGRLMKRLADVVRERSTLFTAARASSLTEYCGIAGVLPLPRVVLLIDGYGTFQAEYMNEVGRQQAFADFQDVLAQGRAVGVHVVMSADRVGALHTSIQALVSRTIVLRLNDENHYGMLGLRKTGLNPQSPAGRGIDGATRLELQVGVLGGAARINEQAKAIESLAARASVAPGERARPIPRMPVWVDGSTMPGHVDGLPVLGIDGTSLEPRGFDLDRTIMIAGQAGTGRTCALAWMASAISRASPRRRIVHLTQRRTSIGDLPAWAGSFSGASAGEEFLATWGAELEKPADGESQMVLCIENVQDFGASMSDGPLVQAIRQARRQGHLIIGEADVQGWASGQLVSELRGARRGLLLAPEGADAQMLFSVIAPRQHRADMPPGRGLWIDAGRVATVQVPLVDTELSPDSDVDPIPLRHAR